MVAGTGSMTSPLSGLTTRGRSFLAAGAACLVAGFVLGERDVLRVALFLLALPLVSVTVVARTRYRLSCSRALQPPRVQAGESATVVLRLENVSRLPSGVMLLEDGLPFTMGARPRFVLDRVEPRGVREVGYPVAPQTRGRYRVGPLSVRLTDPFGMCELTRAFASVDTLLVTPVVQPLPPTRLGGEWTGGGDATARSVAMSGEDDAATREYRLGDDLRKVHWRTTARTGELMVRREEQPWQSRAAVLLDARATAHRGDGPTSSFEYAVSATASVGVHLLGAGFSVRLLGAGADAPGVRTTGAAMLLDRLTTVALEPGLTLHDTLAGLRRSGEGLVVAVLGALGAADAEALARLRHGTTTCIAVLLDAAAWSGDRAGAATYEAAGRLLEAAGWRVLRIPPGGSLAELWPMAGTRTGPRATTEPAGALR